MVGTRSSDWKSGADWLRILPRLIFGGISLIGGLKLLLSFRPNGETTTVELPRSLVLITLSFVTFGLLIERLGLVVAIAGMLVAVEFAGNHKRSIKVFLLLLIGLAAFSIAVFRYLLGIPLEVWPKWT